MTTKFKEAIRKTALLRNRVLTLIQSTLEPLTIAVILKDPQLIEINGGPLAGDKGDYILKQLHKEGVVTRCRVQRPDDPHSRYAYYVPPSDQRKPTKEVKPPVKEVSTAPPDVKLDVIKSSGRLRITYHDLVIEIGVLN